MPADGIQCITGGGATIGEGLCADPRVRKITFTGSRDVGERICKVAGLKKVTMELGSNSPLIVMPDADLDKVATAVAATGYANAGQVCISLQRIIPLAPIYHQFLDALKPKVAALTTGNPLDEGTRVGPMVREDDARSRGDLGQGGRRGGRQAGRRRRAPRRDSYPDGPRGRDP